MKVGIVGSRRRSDKHKVEKLVELLPEDTIVVSGGCNGVDTWAEQKAKEIGLEVDIYYPDINGTVDYYEACEKYYERNKHIVKNSDIICAFVAEDRTGGTENTIKHAKELDVPFIVIDPHQKITKEVKNTIEGIYDI